MLAIRAVLLSVLFLFQSPDILDQVGGYIRESKVEQISEMIGSSIELTIGDREGVYSKKQAEIVLKNFFINHEPRTMQIVHKGNNGENIKYAIGTFSTKYGEIYRVYFLLKLKNGQGTLQELRFEKD